MCQSLCWLQSSVTRGCRLHTSHKCTAVVACAVHAAVTCIDLHLSSASRSTFLSTHEELNKINTTYKNVTKTCTYLHILTASVTYHFNVAANHVTSCTGEICYVMHNIMYDVTYARVKTVSICPTHFLAEYFAEALQVIAAFILCRWL